MPFAHEMNDSNLFKNDIIVIHQVMSTFPLTVLNLDALSKWIDQDIISHSETAPFYFTPFYYSFNAANFIIKCQ
jgi:hypothetical protein